MMAQIRPYRLEEQDHLIHAINTVCAECRYMFGPRFQPVPIWLHALNEPNCSRHYLTVVKVFGQIVGWCRLFPVSCAEHSNIVDLGLGLAREFHGQGIGTSLLGNAIRWAQSSCVRTITLDVHIENQQAQSLFIKFDFNPVSQKDCFYKMKLEVGSKLIGSRGDVTCIETVEL